MINLQLKIKDIQLSLAPEMSLVIAA